MRLTTPRFSGRAPHAAMAVLSTGYRPLASCPAQRAGAQRLCAMGHLRPYAVSSATGCRAPETELHPVVPSKPWLSEENLGDVAGGLRTKSSQSTTTFMRGKPRSSGCVRSQISRTRGGAASPSRISPCTVSPITLGRSDLPIPCSRALLVPGRRRIESHKRRQPPGGAAPRHFLGKRGEFLRRVAFF